MEDEEQILMVPFKIWPGLVPPADKRVKPVDRGGSRMEGGHIIISRPL